MLKTNKGCIIGGLVLAASLYITGSASAQQSRPESVTAEEGRQAGDEMTEEARNFDGGAVIATTRSDGVGTKINSTSHVTWELVATQLDPFGNETVPVFNSAYSGR